MSGKGLSSLVSFCPVGSGGCPAAHSVPLTLGGATPGRKPPKRLGTGQSPLRENKHNLPFFPGAAAFAPGGGASRGHVIPRGGFGSRPTVPRHSPLLSAWAPVLRVIVATRICSVKSSLKLCTIIFFLISCHIVAQYNVKLFLFLVFVINVFLFQYPLFKVLCLFLPKMKLHSLMLSRGSSFRERRMEGQHSRSCWIIQKHLTSSMPNMSPGPEFRGLSGLCISAIHLSVCSHCPQSASI